MKGRVRRVSNNSGACLCGFQKCRLWSRTIDAFNRLLLILRVEIPDVSAHDQGKLNLMMQRRPLRSQDGARVRNQNRRWRLEEEEWLFWSDIVELGDVIA